MSKNPHGQPDLPEHEEMSIISAGSDLDLKKKMIINRKKQVDYLAWYGLQCLQPGDSLEIDVPPSEIVDMNGKKVYKGAKIHMYRSSFVYPVTANSGADGAHAIEKELPESTPDCLKDKK